MTKHEHHSGLDDRVKSLEGRVQKFTNIAWVIGTVAIIFGISGGWVYNTITNLKEKLASTRQDIISMADSTKLDLQVQCDSFKSELDSTLHAMLGDLDTNIVSQIATELSTTMGEAVRERIDTLECRVDSALKPKAHIHKVFHNWSPMEEIEGGEIIRSGEIGCHGGDLLVFVSGSGWCREEGKMIGFKLGLANKTVEMKTYANEAYSHKYMSALAVLPAVLPDRYTYNLKSTSNTITNVKDVFTIVIVELPNGG